MLRYIISSTLLFALGLAFWWPLCGLAVVICVCSRAVWWGVVLAVFFDLLFGVPQGFLSLLVMPATVGALVLMGLCALARVVLIERAPRLTL